MNRSTGIVGTTVKEKTATSMDIISATLIYQLGKAVDGAWKYERLRWIWVTEKTEGDVKDMFGIAQLEFPEILIVPPTNNSVDLIKEGIFQDIPFFNVETEQLERLIS